MPPSSLPPPPLEKPLPRKGKLFAGSDESSASASGRAKIMKSDGKVLEYKTPIKVHQVLTQFSGHAISESLPILRHLQPNAKLVGGQLYYLVPTAPSPKSGKKVRFANPEVVEKAKESIVVRIKLVIKRSFLSGFENAFFSIVGIPFCNMLKPFVLLFVSLVFILDSVISLCTSLVSLSDSMIRRSFLSDFENAFFSLVLTFDGSSWNSLPQCKLLGLCFVYGFKHSRRPNNTKLNFQAIAGGEGPSFPFPQHQYENPTERGFLSGFENAFFSLVLTFDCSWNTLLQSSKDHFPSINFMKQDAKTICVVVRITCFHIRLSDQFVYITCFLIGFNDPQKFFFDFENAFFSLVLTFDGSSWNSLPQCKLLGLCFVYGFKHSR
ncbi:uncharacterized protein G2W53_026361 [Senna tora]|uniref:Uncharacterized protein n=1 Tax=Senna tora TaxID=362788 RepID=A0A834TGV9_9FABA|nr:uncharacterized protein G2W53_026361 [Senna tora]